MAGSALLGLQQQGTLQALRSITTSPLLGSNLLNVLKEEIKHEKEGYAKPQEIASGPPAPFTLSEASDGDTLLTLVRARLREAEPAGMGICCIVLQPSRSFAHGYGPCTWRCAHQACNLAVRT